MENDSNELKGWLESAASLTNRMAQAHNEKDYVLEQITRFEWDNFISGEVPTKYKKYASQLHVDLYARLTILGK
jgi:hypothetical protein